MRNFEVQELKLQKLGEKWKVSSEAQLEDYLWLNLPNLMNLTPFKRQFYINNQICDLLALNSNKQLFIVELKNEEDRYIVSQLTRYYSALFEEKPFSEFIDYNQPIKLIAIAPNFHRDNFTDQKHSVLPISFVEFTIIQDSEKFYFILTNIDKNEVITKREILAKNENHNINIPEPPRVLLNLLKDSSELERKSILSLRELIFNYHPKMKEFAKNKYLLYGSTEKKTCVEFRYDETRKTIALFLWLPHKTSWSFKTNIIVARMRIWHNWQIVSDVGHVPKGNARMISYQEGIDGSIIPLKKLLHHKDSYINDLAYRERFIQSQYVYVKPHYKSPLALHLKDYYKLVGISNISNSLNDLVKLALDTWIKKI